MLYNKRYSHVYRICKMYLLLFHGKTTRTRLIINLIRTLTVLLMRYNERYQHLTIRQPEKKCELRVLTVIVAVLPEEEGQPADHEGSHYNAEGAGSLVLCPPADALLLHCRPCNQRHISALNFSTQKWSVER